MATSNTSANRLSILYSRAMNTIAPTSGSSSRPGHADKREAAGLSGLRVVGNVDGHDFCVGSE